MKGTAWNHMTESHLCTLQAPMWGAGFQNMAIFGVKKWPLWRAGLSAWQSSCTYVQAHAPSSTKCKSIGTEACEPSAPHVLLLWNSPAKLLPCRRAACGRLQPLCGGSYTVCSLPWKPQSVFFHSQRSASCRQKEPPTDRYCYSCWSPLEFFICASFFLGRVHNAVLYSDWGFE